MTTGKLFKTKASLLAACAVFALQPGAASAKSGQAIAYNIEAQSLGTALNELAKQSNKQIHFSSALTRGKRAAQLKDNLTLEQALRRLLASTGLRYRINGNDSIVVEQDVAPPRSIQKMQADADADAMISNAPIIVTGSRVSRPDLESVSPLTVVGSEEIAATGTTRLEDLINSLPQVVAGQGAFVGDTGTSTVDLRGLGAIRTLVLIDGRRLPSGDPFATSPDINQIPAALIKRIEVITGGASSTYGADAVSGVVNFIMDREFEGIQADAQVAFYQHNNNNQGIQDLLAQTGNASPDGNTVDGFTYDLNLTMGAGFDDGRGHVTAYLGYRQIDALTLADRDFSACSLAFSAVTPTGYNCSGSSTIPEGRFLIFDRDTLASRDLMNDANAPGGIRPYTGADSYNFAPTNYFQRPDTRYSAGFFAEYEISPSIVPYAEFQYMNDHSVAQIAYTGTFNSNNPFLQCDNPLFSTAQQFAFGCDRDGNGAFSGAELADTTDQVFVAKRMVEGIPRQSDLRHVSSRAVLGVRGEISSNWKYDAYLLRGNTIFNEVYLNDISSARTDQALDAVLNAQGEIVCRDQSNGCIPLNVFRENGVTREQFDFISVPGLQGADLKTYIASGYVSGNLDNPLGTDAPVSIVLGAEYRKEQYKLQGDENFTLGTLIGQSGPVPATNGGFSVGELFGELRLPLVDFSNGGTVELTGGYRLSDYSTSGVSHTFTGGLEIAPMEGIRLRGVYARAVRAPNVVELFSPQATALFTGNDPCANRIDANGNPLPPAASAAACVNAGVSAAQYGNITPNQANQYNQLTGGNSNLDVEKADTFTAGVVVDGRSMGIPGFTMTADYFNIEIRDAIQGVGAQFALDQCVATGNAQFCDLIQRSSSGSLWIGVQGLVVNTQQNIGGIKTSGVDLAAGYRFPVGSGRLSADYSATYYLNNETQANPAAEFVDCIGLFGPTCREPQPKYRHRVSVGYTADAGWAVTARWRYFGGVDVDKSSRQAALNDPSALGTVDDSISAFNWFDLNTSYNITENFRFSAGVSNIFDKSPPTIGNGFAPRSGNTQPGLYDPAGRYVYVGGRIRF